MDFKLYTNALKAYEAENGDLRVRGTTSSTIRDMHGDEMTLAALKSMEETAKKNMTVFLNHNYNVPDDLFGSVTDATIVKRFDDETSQEVYDLDIDVRVVGEDENPLAMKTYRAIKRGVKLGLSIGARVEKVAKRKSSDGKESYVIDNVRLLEASVVGIPANQRSYLQSALKSLRSSETKAAEFRVGDYVRWSSSGGPAEGEIEKIVTDGTINVPDSSVSVSAEDGDPAVLIRVYRDGKPTDVRVGHKMSTLRSAERPSAKAAAGSVQAGDWVMFANEDEETMCGVVEFVMTEGVLGAEGSEYAIEATTEDPAALVRIYEGEEGEWEATEMLIGQKVSNLTKINTEPTTEESEAEDSYVSNSIDAEVTKAAAIEMGNYVSWKQVEGADGVGEVEQVVKDGEVTVPPRGETVASKPNDPAVLVRVWNPENGGYKPTNEFMGFNASQLTVVPDLDKGKKPEAITVPGLEITNPDEEKKSMEDLEQKKTRVTVTVSTDGDAAPVAAPAVEAEKVEEEPKAEVLASAEKECDCAEGECACEPTTNASVEALQDLGAELVTEKADAPSPAQAAPVQAPAPAPEPAPQPAAAPAEEPKAPVADENRSSRYKSGVSEQVLAGIAGILADLTEEDRDAVLAGLGVQKDGEPEVAPISDPEVTLEVVQEAAPEAAVAAEEAPAEDAAATSLEEVAAIAKSALDAAIAAQQEVLTVKSGLTELAAEKAKVEGELAKAVDLVGRLINVPLGRKHASVITEKSTNGDKAPWLDPFIARLLDAQE